MKECIILFHNPKFEEELNTNPYLIGMENGVYDLAAGIHRNGTPEDKVSISTGNDYPDFDPSDIDIFDETSTIAQVQGIFDFMKQVFPIAPVRRYAYRYLSSLLQGFNTDEKFHVWTGVGGNGKSKLLELFEAAFGEYCFKMPINVLTKSRGQPGQATPELVMSKGRRFGSMQEPDDGAKLNAGLMKEYSGNDKLYYRGMYAEGAIMKPMFTMALLCNHKPKMTSDDEGTWRRMVVLEFIAKFVEGKPKGPYEFTRNTHLAHLFPEWAPWFFAVLTLWYQVYKVEGLNPPKEVLDATGDYRKQSDAYALFIDEYFLQDPTETVHLDESYTIFKDWFSNEFDLKPPPRRDFKSNVDRKLNQCYGEGRKAGWYGYTIRHPNADNAPDMSRAHLTEKAKEDEANEPVPVQVTSQPQPLAKIKTKPKINSRAPSAVPSGVNTPAASTVPSTAVTPTPSTAASRRQSGCSELTKVKLVIKRH